MSPRLISSPAAWAATATVDLAVVAVCAGVLAWQQYCPGGLPACPAPVDRADSQALVLALGLAVLALTAVVALVRGRVVVAALQVVLVAVLVSAAAHALPSAFAQLRSHAHLSATPR